MNDLDPTLIADLVRAGVTDPDLLQRVSNVMHHAIITSQSYDASRDAQRAQAAERSRNYRARKKASHDGPRARVDDSSSKEEIPGKKNTQNASRDARHVSEFKTELQELDPERLEAIIKLRRAKRGQLTGHAAKLFKRDAQSCGLSLAAAVDTCISRNWITVRPEWLQPARPNGQGPPLTETPLTTGSVGDSRDFVREYMAEKAEKERKRAEQDKADDGGRIPGL